MKKGFLKSTLNAIQMADIVIEVVDARFVEQTRNREMEEKAIRKGKKLLIAINKQDLVSKKKALEQKKALPFPSVFLSAKNREGVNMLRKEIGKMAGDRKAKIAIIGYPNTGKSTVINILGRRHAAKVSSSAGLTRGEQFVRISSNQLLIDTPGIIPFEEKDPYKLALLGAKNPEKLEDIELAGMKLLEFMQEKFPEKIEKILGKQVQGKNPEQLLEEIAVKWNKIGKGGKPDTETTAKILLKQWQEGKN